MVLWSPSGSCFINRSEVAGRRSVRKLKVFEHRLFKNLTFSEQGRNGFRFSMPSPAAPLVLRCSSGHSLHGGTKKRWKVFRARKAAVWPRAPGPGCALGASARAAPNGRIGRAGLDSKRRFTGGAAFVGREACAIHDAAPAREATARAPGRRRGRGQRRRAEQTLLNSACEGILVKRGRFLLRILGRLLHCIDGAGSSLCSRSPQPPRDLIG